MSCTCPYGSPCSCAYAGVYGGLWDTYAMQKTPGEQPDYLAPRVTLQLARVSAGARLPDYRSAESSALFLSPATNDATAYLKTAYWLAVDGRIRGSRRNVGEVTTRAAKGTTLGQMPGYGYVTGNVRSIYQSAATMVTDPSVKAILQSGTGQAAGAVERGYAKTERGLYVDPVVAASQLHNPDGEQPLWIKLLIGVVVVGVTAYAARQITAAAKAAKQLRGR